MHPTPRPFLVASVLTLLLACRPADAQSLAEALDNNLTWTTGGDTGWLVQTNDTHDGVDAARSGSVSSNQISWIETAFTGPVTLRCWKKASQLSFPPGLAVSMRIDGQTGTAPMLSSFWTEDVIDFGAGPHTVRWVVQAGSAASSTNYFLLDQVRLDPPRPLEFAYEPVDQTIYAGEALNLSAYATGPPPLHYQWRKDGSDLPGRTSSWLGIYSATTNDSGVYSVIVTNADQQIVSSNATVTVLPAAAPFFTLEPTAGSAYSGSSVYLTGSVDGSPPFVSWWLKDEQPLSWSRRTNQLDGAFLSLTLTNLALADAGLYRLVVSNAIGRVESSNAALVVLPSAAPVVVSQPRSLEVAAGVSTWLSVTVTGAPTPQLTWCKVGQPNPAPSPPPLPSGPPVVRKSFTNAQPTDAGIYYVIATNVAGGAVSRQALLTVLDPISVAGSWSAGAEDVVLTNGLAYLARGSDGITILSLTNPAAPALIGQYDTPGFAHAIRVKQNLAYIAAGGAGLLVLDVADPADPVLVGQYDSPGDASDIALRGNQLLLGDGTGGLILLDVINPAAPVFLGKYQTNIRAWKVHSLGNLAVLSSAYDDVLPGTNVAGTVLLDISDPTNPVPVARLGFGFTGLDSSAGLLYGATGSGLKILSLADPAAPAEVGSFQYYANRFRLSVLEVVVRNEHAFLVGNTTNFTDFFVLDVANPAEPIPVGYLGVPGHAHTLAIDGPRACLAAWDGPLQILQTPFAAVEPPAPWLGWNRDTGLSLEVHGRSGRHYALEAASNLNNLVWQACQTLFLTNSTLRLEIPMEGGACYFRLQQLP